jgi:hypothetical protein
VNTNTAGDVHYRYEPAWDRRRTITGSYVQSQQSRWFDELTSRKLRRSAHCNLADLEAGIPSPPCCAGRADVSPHDGS